MTALDEDPADVWRKLHRQRLVAYSKAHPGQVDAAFTEFVQCYPQQCSAMEAEYGKAPAVSFVDALDAHRFVASIDGNGYPMRTRGVLCSGSLALLGGIFTSWLSPRLQPHGQMIRHMAGAGRGCLRARRGKVASGASKRLRRLAASDLVV